MFPDLKYPWTLSGVFVAGYYLLCRVSVVEYYALMGGVLYIDGWYWWWNIILGITNQLVMSSVTISAASGTGTLAYFMIYRLTLVIDVNFAIHCL